MTSTTNTNFDPALKQLYRSSNVAKLTYKMRPLFGMLNKFEGFGGRNMPIVIQYGNPQGRSATFSNAQSNRTQVRLEDFLLTRVNNYSIATIDGETIETTRGDNMAFLSALKTKIDAAMAALADDHETSLFRDGLGHLGTIGSVTVADPMVITLGEIEEIPNFEVGMTLTADDTAAGSSLRATPATAVVNGVDRVNGTVTTNYDNSGSTTDWAAADYLFVQGDESGKISGLAAWSPATVGATAFFGVDRTTDSRLAGLYHDGSADPIEEGAIDAQSKIGREGGIADKFLIHHAQMRRLSKELGAKKEYSQTNAQTSKGVFANVGYRGIAIDGDYGPIECVACNKAEAEVGHMIDSSGWTLNTIGNATKFLMEDGLRILRQASADGYEVRLGFRGNLSNKTPIWNAHVKMPAV